MLNHSSKMKRSLCHALLPSCKSLPSPRRSPCCVALYSDKNELTVAVRRMGAADTTGNGPTKRRSEAEQPTHLIPSTPLRAAQIMHAHEQWTPYLKKVIRVGDKLPAARKKKGASSLPESKSLSWGWRLFFFFCKQRWRPKKKNTCHSRFISIRVTRPATSRPTRASSSARFSPSGYRRMIHLLVTSSDGYMTTVPQRQGRQKATAQQKAGCPRRVPHTTHLLPQANACRTHPFHT